MHNNNNSNYDDEDDMQQHNNMPVRPNITARRRTKVYI